jgi:hypothetical protein
MTTVTVFSSHDNPSGRRPNASTAVSSAVAQGAAQVDRHPLPAGLRVAPRPATGESS